MIEFGTPQHLSMIEESMMAKDAKIDLLRAVIIRYLDFALDVGISPAAPELKPIRDAMREAIKATS